MIGQSSKKWSISLPSQFVQIVQIVESEEGEQAELKPPSAAWQVSSGINTGDWARPRCRKLTTRFSRCG